MPGLKLILRDERTAEPTQEVFQHDGGIAEFVEHLAVDGAVTDSGGCTAPATSPSSVPVLDATGALTPTEVEREAVVDVALRWGTGYDTEVRSFVNIIATPKGGTHPDRVRAGVAEDVPDPDRGALAGVEGWQ